MASVGSPAQEPASGRSTVPSAETTATDGPSASSTCAICGIDIVFPHRAALLPTETIEEYRIFEDRHMGDSDCDVVVQCDGSLLRAHKELLAERIPYFTLMYSHEFLEKSSGVVTLSTQHSPLDSASIQALISYAYDGQLTITEENARSLLAAAAYLQMDSITDATAIFLYERVECDSALSLLADFRSAGIHHERLERFVDANFVPISCTSSFSRMSCDDLVELLQRDSLRIDSEEQVFAAVSRWIDVDKKRWKDGPRLLSHVRLPSLRKSFISECIASRDWAKDSPDCVALLKKHLDSRAPRRDRFCKDALNIICFLRSRRPSGGALRIFNPLTGVFADVETSWTQGEDRAVIDSKVYFLGTLREPRRVRVLDTATNSWSEFPSMPSERECAAIQVIDGILYIAGGYEGDDIETATLFACDTREANPVWIELAPMQHGRAFAASSVSNGLLYLFGGWDREHNVVEDCEVYDPAKNEWSEISPMNRPTHRASATAVDGRIFVLGGNECEQYDPATDTWASLPKVMYGSYRGLYFSSGHLFAVDLEWPDSEVFSPTTRQWTTQSTGQEDNYSREYCQFAVPVPAAVPFPITAFEQDERP